jgi:acetolactate decarboxylase
MLLLAITGCRTVYYQVPTASVAGVYQYSTLQALIEGVYDGERTLEELRRQGDFGIGTFNALDGEMILLDGEFYQVRADGLVYRPSLETRTPFAAVVSFVAEETWELPAGLDYASFREWLDGKIGGADNLPVAVHVRGRFGRVRTRSVPAQSPPYPRLTEVTRHQPEFAIKACAGRLVGFRLPPYLAGINMAGYHLHFISDDLKSGGHLLDFETVGGTVEICRRHRLVLDLPASEAFTGADLANDKQADVHAVER